MFLPKAGKTAPRTFSAPARPDDRRWPRLKIPVKDVNGDRPPICLRPVPRSAPRFAPRFASVWAVSRSRMGRAHFDLRDGICPTCARHGRIRLRPRDQGRRASRKRRAIKKPASLKMRVFQRSRHYLENYLEKFLVPTARLELAQLSPLPPQDSVSTNFTTSANFCQKSHAFLESRTFYHAIGASRQFVTPRRSAPAAAGPPPLPAQQALTSRAAPGINLSCRPAILASPCAHPGPSPGEFPPRIFI